MASPSPAPALGPLIAVLSKAGICDPGNAGHVVADQTPARTPAPLPIDLLKDIRAWLVSLQPLRDGSGGRRGEGGAGAGARGPGKGKGQKQVGIHEAETKPKLGSQITTIVDEVATTTPTTTKDPTNYTLPTRLLFTQITTTAALPSLTNPHRTTACDVLSTWLIRSSSPPFTPIHHLLLTPFHHPNSSASHPEILAHHISVFTTLTHLLLANFDSSASAALLKALKDLFATLLVCYRRIFLRDQISSGPNSAGGDAGRKEVEVEGEVDVYIEHLLRETLALLGLGKAATATAAAGSPLAAAAAAATTSTFTVSERRRKAAYFILEALVSHKTVSAQYLLAATDSSSTSSPHHNHLLHHLLTTVSIDRALASAASKLFLALLTARKSEYLAQSDEEGWLQWTHAGWGELLRAALRGELASPSDIGAREELAGEDKAAVLARGNLTTYTLPGVFRLIGVAGLRGFVGGFEIVAGEAGVSTVTVKGREWDVNAWLCCIRVGREIGFIDDIDDSAHTTTSPDAPTAASHAPTAAVAMHLPPSVIPPLLTHPSLPIRISALTLLTASRQTTRPPSSVSLSLLRAHLPHFHALTDPEGRNVVTGLVRMFIERLAGASAHIARRAAKERLHGGVESGAFARELDAQVDEMRGFVEWYVGFIRGQLLPGKGFPRVGMALRGLRILAGSGLDSLPPSLSDKVGQNSPHAGALQFPFRVPVFEGATREGREMARLLIECLFHSFEDVRVEAAGVIKAGLLPAAYAKTVLDMRLLGRCFDKVRAGGGRARDTDGLARMLEILYEAAISWEDGFRVTGALFGVGGDVVTLATPLGYITYFTDVVLCGRFLDKLKSGSLAERMADCAAIHGVISGLRLIFERKDTYEHISRATSGELAIWRSLHRKLISFCCDIWDIVGPVLCAAAPEGHMPDAEEDGEDDTAGADDFYSTGGDVTTQTLMSYSWRAIKESSELLSVLVSNAPYPHVLTHDDILRSGELLIAELANSRHAGAFAAVSPCLLQVAKRCFTCPDAAVRELPRVWLAENSVLIVTKAGAITRRSAGIPFLIIGILTAEIDPQRPLLHGTFARFVEIAKMPPPEEDGGETGEGEDGGGTKLDLPQVHALNCIKLLFSDSRLGPIVANLIGQGLDVAVSCFASPVWAIRNGGLMLFTALLNRLFGTSRSRDDYSFTASLYTTSRFFEKYPTVRGVLLSQLRRGVESLSSPSATLPSSNVPIVEMVYPALSLVSRLGASPGYVEGDEFRSLILECMKSRLWKVREVAAKAYVTLIEPEVCMPEIASLLNPTNKIWVQNTLHGNLCAVKCLIERRVGQVSDATGTQIHLVSGELARILTEAFESVVKRNGCLVTRTLYLEIAGLVAWNYEKMFTSSLGAFSPEAIAVIETSVLPLRVVLSEYASENIILSEPFSGSTIVGNPIFREQVAKIMTHRTIREKGPDSRVWEIISLIEGDDNEIILTICKVLMGFPGALSLSNDQEIALKTILWTKAIDDSNWGQVRVACMQLLDMLLKSYQGIMLSGGRKIDWMVLLDLITDPRTIPLKEASLVVLGKVMLSVWASKTTERQQLRPLWLEQVSAASREEMPCPSRECALESLKGMAPILDLSSSSSSDRPYSSLLPLYISLYDFLNDDDHDVREAASAFVTHSVFHMACPMISLAANDLLATKLGEVFRGLILKPAVGRIIGQKSISEILAEARENSDTLFTKEKQNVWVDDVREVDLWKEIIERELEAHQGKRDMFRSELLELLTFVRDGMEALLRCQKEIAIDGMSGDDVEGPLGWSTASEDVFLLGWRVFSGFGIAKTWRRLASTEDGEPLNGLWLQVVELEKRLGHGCIFEAAGVSAVV